jgi:hypothetical protein
LKTGICQYLNAQIPVLVLSTRFRNKLSDDRYFEEGNSMKDYFIGFLSILATNIPIYLIWVVGFILAVIRWRRHPEVSSLVLFALLVLFTLSIASAMQSMLPIYLTQELDYSYTQVSMLIGGIGIVQIILSAGAWIAVIVALFGWRKSNQPA